MEKEEDKKPEEEQPIQKETIEIIEEYTIKKVKIL